MIKSICKAAVLAVTITLSAPVAQAAELSGSEVALFLTIKTQPGQRDALVALWDEHLKTRTADNSDHVSYLFALDMTDPDTVHISEVYADRTAFETNIQSQWFETYMAKAGKLLADEPGLVMASPHWVK